MAVIASEVSAERHAGVPSSRCRTQLDSWTAFTLHETFLYCDDGIRHSNRRYIIYATISALMFAAASAYVSTQPISAQAIQSLPRFPYPSSIEENDVVNMRHAAKIDIENRK
jgi:hypothetical protein